MAERYLKRYLGLGNLKIEIKPEYICSVCSQIGFAFEHTEGKPDWHSELCRVCGFYIDSNLDKDKWYKAWKECGSEALFEKPYDERIEYMDKIQDTYLRFDYYIPTDLEAKELNISERAFSQNGFQHVTDSKKTIVVEFEGNISKYPYETNKIIKIKDNGAYFAICEKDDLPYLFVSKSFTYNDKVVRSSYIGLTPEVFYVAMAIIPPYEVEDISGNTYKIWIE